MVGSADFANAAIDGQVNVAVSLRQPGSAIKPVLYATAFDDNLISPASVLWDTPVTYTLTSGEVYTPLNYDRRYHGPVTVRTALANSYNVPAVELLNQVGVERMLTSARAMGIQSLVRSDDWYGLSLTVGGGEVKLLDLATAYHTIANQGRYIPPQFVLSITNNLGQSLWKANREPQQAISEAAAYLVTDILRDEEARRLAFGDDSPLNLSRPAAAKTGTTDDWRDNWTLGFTRYFVAGVWAGNTDGRPMRGATGVTGAAPIWHTFMEALLSNSTLLRSLEASTDPAAWEFPIPPMVERRDQCPPGLTCRAEGEYFSQAWLQAMGDAGPLADSVIFCPPGHDRNQGFLKLPGSPDRIRGGDRSQMDKQARQVQENALAWSRTHGIPVSLGTCDDLVR
jgi:membrane carboxypeptidase/penicillin-binding protein PbpC